LKKIVRLLRHDLPLHFVLILTNWLPDNTVFLRFRGWLARPFLASSGSGLRLGRNVTLFNPSEISFGEAVYVAQGCWFMAGAPIRVGNEVLFGPYCVVVSSSHTRRYRSFRFGPSDRKAIEIGDGSWLASHVVVTNGSVIGQGSAVGSHSVVKGKIPADSLAVGQPARVVKMLSDEELE